MKKSRFMGVYEDRRDIFTKNFAPKKRVYTERLVRNRGVEYRSWDPKKSKLAAGIKKGLTQLGIKPGHVVLYLGAASGTTASHVSDIVGEDGFVFALDFAPRVIRDLIFVCETRKNMGPIIADASKPDSYITLVSEVDAVFQDIAQKKQTEIFLANCDRYLKKDGFGIIAVKSRSVDIKRRPKAIFNEVKDKIKKAGMIITDYKELDPYERDHAIIICKKVKDL